MSEYDDSELRDRIMSLESAVYKMENTLYSFHMALRLFDPGHIAEAMEYATGGRVRFVGNVGDRVSGEPSLYYTYGIYEFRFPLGKKRDEDIVKSALLPFVNMGIGIHGDIHMKPGQQ